MPSLEPVLCILTVSEPALSREHSAPTLRWFRTKKLFCQSINLHLNTHTFRQVDQLWCKPQPGRVGPSRTRPAGVKMVTRHKGAFHLTTLNLTYRKNYISTRVKYPITSCSAASVMLVTGRRDRPGNSPELTNAHRNSLMFCWIQLLIGALIKDTKSL